MEDNEKEEEDHDEDEEEDDDEEEEKEETYHISLICVYQLSDILLQGLQTT